MSLKAAQRRAACTSWSRGLRQRDRDDQNPGRELRREVHRHAGPELRGPGVGPGGPGNPNPGGPASFTGPSQVLRWCLQRKIPVSVSPPRLALLRSGLQPTAQVIPGVATPSEVQEASRPSHGDTNMTVKDASVSVSLAQDGADHSEVLSCRGSTM